MISCSYFSIFLQKKIRSTKKRFGPAEFAIVPVRMTTRSQGLLLNSAVDDISFSQQI